jgi:hypothetical protein
LLIERQLPVSSILDTLIAELAISISPQVERRSPGSEVSTGLSDVPDPTRVLDDSLLSMNLSLIVGHSDPLGHLVP